MAGIRVRYAERLASKITTSTLDRNRQDSASSSTKQSLVTVEKPTLPKATRNLSKHNQTGACTLSCPFYCNSGYLKFEKYTKFRPCAHAGPWLASSHCRIFPTPALPAGLLVQSSIRVSRLAFLQRSRSALELVLTDPQSPPRLVNPRQPLREESRLVVTDKWGHYCDILHW